MKKMVALSKEEFVKYITLQTRTIKAYLTGEIKPVDTVEILLYQGLEKVVIPHIVIQEDKTVSFGSSVLKLEEWEVFGDIDKTNTFSIVIRSASGMFVTYPLFKIKRSFFEDFKDLEPYIRKFENRFFLLLHSMLYNSFSKELLATKEEFLNHKGTVNLGYLK